MDGGIGYWDGFEVVLVEGQQGIECEGAGAVKQGAYRYGWVDGARGAYSNDGQGSLLWISRSCFWVNVDGGIELVEDDVYVVGAHSSREDQYFVVVKGTSCNVEFTAGFGPNGGVEVLGHGRISVWLTHSENKVGDVGCDKPKMVDATVWIEDEFRRGELVHGKYL